ncbi:MAG: choice-of-anchor L domain-containing protein, partial [Bacteroidota bacterium]
MSKFRYCKMIKHKETNIISHETSYLVGLYFFVFIIFFNINIAWGQIIIDNSSPNNSPSYLVQNVLMGLGVTAYNVTFNGDAAFQIGYFDGTASNIGIPTGIILCSGDVNDAVGPNDESGSGTGLGGAGDVDLTAIVSPSITNDAAVLEFDFVPIGDSVIFRYVFASEEYLEYVFAGFNDVFGFFISGPGFAGPYSNGAENIALLPDTITPVSIDNVNNVVNPVYYIDNGDGFSPPQNTDPTVVQFDGFTVVLEARAIVQCGETYHIKLAVADAGDGVLNSAVFLESESFYSPGVSVTVNTPTILAGQPAVVEGCVDATFTFNRPDADDTVTFNFDIGGNAINGTDYVFIADSVTLLLGEFSQDVTITPIADGLTEGVDTITITVYNVTPCGDTIPQTEIVYIYDDYNLIVVANDVQGGCPGDPVPISASVSGGYAPYTYSWSSGDVGNPVIVTPASTDTFFVDVNDDAGCLGSDTMVVFVYPLPVVDAGQDTTVCISSPVMIGGSPTGPPGSIYSWVPVSTLNNPALANPTATTAVSTTYTVTVTDINGCVDTAQVTVSVTTAVLADAGPDTTICSGESTVIGGTPTGNPGSAYSWSPATDLDDPALANPTTTTSSTITYIVTVTDAYGCLDSDSIAITVNPLPSANAGADTTICFGESAQLNANGGVTYNWSPSTGLSDTTLPGPWASPASSTTYTVIVTDTNGCVNTDSITVFVDVWAISDAGADVGICSGESDTIGTSPAPNCTYSWTPATGLSNSTVSNPVVILTNFDSIPDTVDYIVITGDTTTSCISSDTVRVIVYPYHVSDAGTEVSFCSGDSAQLGTVFTPGYNYAWLPVTGLSDPAISGPVVTLTNFGSAPDTTDYVVTTTIYVCSSSDTVQVVVRPYPIPDAGADVGFCSGDTAQ